MEHRHNESILTLDVIVNTYREIQYETKKESKNSIIYILNAIYWELKIRQYGIRQEIQKIDDIIF